MQSKPKRPCNKVGCPELTRDTYCDKHKREKRSYDKNRGTAAQRGYGAKWRKARKYFLAQHPFCVCDKCKNREVPLMADVVDHIIPHRGDPNLFWDQSNWQPMNHRCHSRKTVQKDGGFGNG
jgi:5-methylcytosine-specific restriction protein A